jgi:Amt family ammonium transporter
VLGWRLTSDGEKLEPHNVTYVVLGAGLLWFGWFGFNAGSALGANGLAANAFVTTNTAAAMACLTWMTASWIRHKRPSVVGAAAGAVAGLVAITPAAGFVTPTSAIIIGFLAGAVCFFAVEYVVRRTVDDALDVFGVHGVGGILGAILTGVFATTSVNSAGVDGLLYGNFNQVVIQTVAVVVVGLYAAVMTWVILKVLDVTMGLRVKPEEERTGLDVSLHGEPGYQM